MTLHILPDAEFQRINALPRRSYTDAQIADLVAYYTAKLRAPYGTQTLKPVQAMAIHEAITTGGVFGPIGCGEGKTIVSLLIPRALGLQRPLIVVPANLKTKTQRELPEIGQHWLVPDYFQTRSYSELAIESRASELDDIGPDGIICDEAHKLKNPKAAITRRIGRYLAAHPECKFFALSGTLLTDNIDDLCHIAAWSLRHGSPYPFSADTIRMWRSVLDGNASVSIDLGPIVEWPIDGLPSSATDYMRNAVRRRALETPGVVASSTGEAFTGSILINPLEVATPAHVEPMFRELREDWRTPDGWTLASPIEIWAKARELAIGLHYQWDPRPPREWLAARSSYAFFVRDYIDRAHHVDTERQVRTLLERGECSDHPLLVEAWSKWMQLAPTFTVNPVAVWHDDGVIDACIRWAKKAPGIVWTSHRHFAERLAEKSGMAYYANDAEDARTGRHVRDHSPKESMIASVESCGTGQNLQAFYRNLWTAPRGKSPEQLIARTHRPGQLKDEIIFDALLSCREHLQAIPRAVRNAQMVVATVPNATQKILRADITWPDEDEYRAGWAYAENRSRPLDASTLEALLDELDDSL